MFPSPIIEHSSSQFNAASKCFAASGWGLKHSNSSWVMLSRLHMKCAQMTESTGSVEEVVADDDAYSESATSGTRLRNFRSARIRKNLVR